jgi:hypothetical protein
VDRVIALFSQFLEQIPAEDRPCEELARVVDEFVDQRGEELREVSRVIDDAPLDRRAWFQAALNDGLNDALKEHGHRLSGCQGDPEVSRAFQRMDNL